MARFYHVDIARHASGADGKWIDNLLSHFTVPGVVGGRQGTPRRITESGVCHIVLIWRLYRALGVRCSDSVSLAIRLLDGVAAIELVRGVELTLDRPAFEREVARLVEQAVEAVVPARRGRPLARATVP